MSDSFELTLLPSSDPVRFAFSSSGERDHIAAFVREYGLVHYEAPALLAALVAAQPDPTPAAAPGFVLDIGANTGIFTLLAAAASPHVRVCAFEPLDIARDLLLANIACNPHLADRIQVEPFALSRTRSVAPFFETINDHGLVSTSSSLELAHADLVGLHVRREVATETLDNWAVQTDRPIRLMKIDVEGHKHAVLQGGHRTITRHRPIIIVEILGIADIAALNHLLHAHDYRDFALAPDALRPCPAIGFHPDAWNHLLCPSEQTGLLVSACENLDLSIAAA
jgi:FkbM family methyltransferase